MSMAYQLELRENARTGVINGFKWYETKSEGLGARFVQQVEDVIEYIGKDPLHFQVRYKDYREALLKNFPYVVIYQVIGNLVIVSSVYPARANPEKKI